MNRVLGGLSGRVFLAAAICAGLSAAISTGMVLLVLIEQAITRVAVIMPDLDPVLRQRCERDPGHFRAQFGANLELSFYDAVTLRPALPDMPPVDPVLLSRLRSGREVPARMYFFDSLGGAALRRTAERGACSLLQIRWHVGRRERRNAWILILALPALSAAIAVALTSFFAVRPITLRLRRLRRATQQIGQAAGYASAFDAEVDDLGQLSLLLDSAHARIAADADAAALRQQALEQHLANVAHDLRTPLTSLQLTIESLTAIIPKDDGGHVRNAVNDVVYMGALISNLYLACRLQDGADPLFGAPLVDLGALVAHVTRRFKHLGRARTIEVEGMQLDIPVWVRCNPAMAEQVLANLVHNAIVHGDQGGHVAILLEATPERFTLSVLDDGPGVPPADMPRLGEQTFRNDAARRRAPQVGGLGLAITAEVCRRAGFNLAFAARQPRGLRVTVEGLRVSANESAIG